VVLLSLTLLGGAAQGRAQEEPPPAKDSATIEVDLGQVVGPMRPIWSYVGYDEANYTYFAEGRKLLSDLAELSPGPVHVRAHGLLSTVEGDPVALKWASTNAYTEDAEGRPVYDWTLVDSIVDTWVDLGMKPFMEIGFMPKALSTNPEPYRHYWQPSDPGPRSEHVVRGQFHPPNDYERWGELVYQWVRHSVERYGATEVETWWWQVWNEPNIFYWQGSMEEFLMLHDYAAEGVKRALPTARIGGPNTSAGTGRSATTYLRGFLEHARSGINYATGETGSPLDFFSFHAKGAPSVTEEGVLQMGLENQLRQIEGGLQLLAEYPEFSNLPIIIGESDPEGCAACPSSIYPEHDYRNGTVYASYTAAQIARTYQLADEHGADLVGAVTWAFTFPGQDWFAGFRSLASNGVNKPVLNVLRMFGMMRGDRVIAASPGNPYSASVIMESGVRDGPDIAALASKGNGEAQILVWNYHDDFVPSPDATVTLHVDGIPTGRVLARHYRVDEDHSNAYTAWQEMGSPQDVTPAQRDALERAAKLAMLDSPTWTHASGGLATLQFELPRRGVSLVTLSW